LLCALVCSTVLADTLRTRYKKLAELSGYTSRIDHLVAAIDQGANRAMSTSQADGNSSSSSAASVVRMDNVTITTPTDQVLARSVRLNVQAGDGNLLITGPNGSGKSSICRVLCGLWPAKVGNVDAPRDMVYVPQRPYLAVGTLREQLTYPLRA
jgi:ABC-type uncharacterized transport system fused permease/ATPase subunit